SGWDSKQFLDQVCVKAGLHPTSWHDDATMLFTFEGESLRAPLADPGGTRAITGRRAGACGPQDLPSYASFCRDNVIAMLHGATPNYFLVGAPDGNVSAALLTIQQPQDAANATTFCQLSLRPGVPLQSTLFALGENAAQVIARQRPRPE